MESILIATTSTNTIKPVLCDNDGKLQIDIDMATEGIATETTLSSIDTRLDNSIGALENTTAIGGGSSQLRVVALGYDRTNEIGRSILVDSGGIVSTADSAATVILATIDTAVDLTNTKLTAQATHNTNLLTKNTEIDTAIDLTNTKLTAQATHNTSQLAVLTTIDTAVDLSNTLSANTLGAQANLMSSVSCVLAGTESSVVDFGANTSPTKITILCTSSTTSNGNGVNLWLSADNSTWSKAQTSLYLSNTDAGSNTINTSLVHTVDIAKVRYVKIKVFALGTFTCSVIGSN